MHHFHFHIHALIHYIRHARLIGSYVRSLGLMLFMLLFSLLGMTGIGTESSRDDGEWSRRHGAGIISAWSSPAATAAWDRADRETPVSAPAVAEDASTGVFHRLSPKIIMVPRMNRVPKPKSVYRNFARAPGILSFV